MNMKLVVVRAFGHYARGDVMTDKGDIEKVLASEHAGHVVKVAITTSAGA